MPAETATSSNDHSIIPDIVVTDAAPGCPECMPERPLDPVPEFRYLDRAYHPSNRPHATAHSPAERHMANNHGGN